MYKRLEAFAIHKEARGNILHEIIRGSKDAVCIGGACCLHNYFTLLYKYSKYREMRQVIVSIVLFYVLFVCQCILYCCHRVSTQLQLNISYHIISYHINCIQGAVE